MDLFNIKRIYSLTTEPEGKTEFDRWTSQEDVVSFLSEDLNDEYIIVYSSLPHTFVHSVFIPKPVLTKDLVNDLLKWSSNPFSSWGLTCSSSDAWIEPPLYNSGSQTLSTGEQIVFGRSFEGINSNRNYYEINQKISHVLDIHFIPERNAWCRLDDHGDMLDVFKIIEIDDFPRNETGTIICVKKDVLSEYSSVENLTLMRMFDFTRYRSDNFLGWDNKQESKEIQNSKSIYGSLMIKPGTGSYSNGFQLVEINIPKENIVDRAWGRPIDEGQKKYCSFIANDWKNQVISEISCDPDCISNYFTESDLPYEITPAFFRPEVLAKYKADRAKYKLGTRSVSCRGAWHLKTFDINSAGQVHTYLIYLSSMPYEEQLHWKQYNENPKAPLSARAIRTDFEGQFYEGYDPLPSLKHKLEVLHTQSAEWWVLRDESAPDKVHYPYTESKDEWAEEILNLDQLLVEGLQEKWLRKKAKELGCKPDDRLRALKLLEIILVAIDFNQDHAREIMTPFHVVHNLRSLLKGHTSGTEAEKERKKALKEHGNFRKHFEKISADCDETIKIIGKALKEI
ncbi:MAG: hypothetical protein COB38_13000 [Gammaproteobacteria bacterium]|nr:MAG: hypothetical protein COB38_13000 [Gammaproteobacteria bacterium]